MLAKNNPRSYNHKYCATNGIRMHYIDENPSGGTTLLLCHGWPDLWLGWREQIHFLVGLGYRVIAPSLRGFGETDAPDDPSEYGMKTIANDLAGLLDHLELSTVIVIGHDWGGLVVWRFTQFFPQRVQAVASFCTPYSPPAKEYLSLEDVVKRKPNFSYQLYLVTPEAEKEINENVQPFFNRIFRPTNEFNDKLVDLETGSMVVGRPYIPKSDAVPQSVMDYYVEQFTKTGARGGLNWYKQSRANFEQCKDLDPIIQKPALMVCAEKDRALPPSMAKGMKDFIPQLEMHTVPDSGHWILWEKPEECNSYLKQWLGNITLAQKL